MGLPLTKTAANELEWIRPPQQARTRESLGRMLDAAEQLVSRQGFDDTSIAEIAQAAGASVGGFYRRFRDKQGLLHALHERFCDEARATADAALDPARWSGASTAEVVGAFGAFLVRIFREREGFFRAFVGVGINDEVVRRRTSDLVEYLHQRLRLLLADRRADLSHPDPDLACALGLNIVLGTLNHAVQLQPTELGLADARLDTEMPRAFLAYLGVRA